MGPESFDLQRFLFHYFVEWHPVYFLYMLGKQYTTDDVNTGIWLAVAVLGIAVWFVVTRLAAEVPGRRHGAMLVWWVIFSALHLYSIPIYFAYEIFASSMAKQHQTKMHTRYADRSRWTDHKPSEGEFKHLPKEFK